MVLLGVLVAGALCLALDWWLRRGDGEPSVAAASPPVREPSLGPAESVGGLRWQPEMGYHPGHAWVLPLSPGRVRVGIDDLAARRVGADGVQLPEPGTSLVQGAAGWRLLSEGRRVAVLSPVTGTVVARHPADPQDLRDDPYGAGWLLEVAVADLHLQWNNLLHGPAARRWLRGTPPVDGRMREVLRTNG